MDYSYLHLDVIAKIHHFPHGEKVAMVMISLKKITRTFDFPLGYSKIQLVCMKSNFLVTSFKLTIRNTKQN